MNPEVTKIVKVVVKKNASRYAVSQPIYKEDYGLHLLLIDGIELPNTYAVDFSNSETRGTSVTVFGNSDGVLIPKQLIDTGKDIFAFLYITGEDFGRTVYKFKIPNRLRPDRTSETPTPTQQSVIDQTINALNTAVEQAEAAKEMLENVSATAFSLPEGADPVATYSNGLFTFGIPAGGGEGGGGGGEYVGLAVVNGQLCVSYDG